MLSEEALDQFVQHVYDAPGDPAGWERVLREMAGPLRAIPGIVLRSPTPGDPGHRLTFDTGPPFDESWDELFVRFEREHGVISRLPAGSVTTCARELPEATYLRTEMYNDWMRPLRRRHFIVAIASREGPAASGPSFQREEGLPDFSGDEIALLERLLPHFRQALRLERLLAEAESARRVQHRLADALPLGVILVDARGRILEANARAEALLCARDGLSRGHDTLEVARASERRALARLVGEAAATGAGNARAPGGVLRIARPSGRRPLLLLALPLGRDTAFRVDPRRPAALVVVSDPEDAPELPAAQVQRLYGLSAAEARTALALAQGLPVREIAERAGVQENTVRWHLKQSYAKTGTRGQTELVRLLLTGPLVLGAPPPPAAASGRAGRAPYPGGQ